MTQKTKERWGNITQCNCLETPLRSNLQIPISYQPLKLAHYEPVRIIIDTDSVSDVSLSDTKEEDSLTSRNPETQPQLR